MKITFHRIDEENQTLKICLESENQEESAKLYRYALRCKLPVKTYGRIDNTCTWAWLQIPVKKDNYDYYFGTDPNVVK